MAKIDSLSFFQLAALWFRSRILRDRAARWYHQYALGLWDKLRLPEEQAPFIATALLLTRHVPPGRVLEIGCGEVLLQQQLNAADYLDWVGVDSRSNLQAQAEIQKPHTAPPPKQ